MATTFRVSGQSIRINNVIFNKNSLFGYKSNNGWVLKGDPLDNVAQGIEYDTAIDSSIGEVFQSEAEFDAWIAANALWPPYGNGNGGVPQTLIKGTGVGEIGITQGNNITINTIAADGTTAEDPNTYNIGGTGMQVFDLIGAQGVPAGTEGLLVHFQRQASGGNAEFQLFSSDEPSNFGIFARWKIGTTFDDYSDWSLLTTDADIIPYGLGISLAEAQATQLNDATEGGFYVAQQTDPNKPPEFPAQLWATYVTIGFTDGNNNQLASQITVRSHDGLDFDYLGYRGLYSDGTWGSWRQVYDTQNPPALEVVTGNGNTTGENAIIVTGIGGGDPTTAGLQLINEAGTSIISNSFNGGVDSELELSLQTPINAAARFSGRVSGSEALNDGDFTTLAQVNALIAAAIST